MSNHMTWRILATKTGAEKKVCNQLLKLQIDHYCPASKAQRKALGRGSMFEHPIFDRKVFVKISDAGLNVIKVIDGVQNLVYWLQQPAEMAASDVDTIRNFIANHENIVVEKITINTSQKAATFFLNPNENNGAGQKEKPKYSKAVLPSLGIALVAPAIKHNVEILKVVSSRHSIPKIFTGSYR